MVALKSGGTPESRTTAEIEIRYHTVTWLVLMVFQNLFGRRFLMLQSEITTPLADGCPKKQWHAGKSYDR